MCLFGEGVGGIEIVTENSLYSEMCAPNHMSRRVREQRDVKCNSSVELEHTNMEIFLSEPRSRLLSTQD